MADTLLIIGRVTIIGCMLCLLAAFAMILLQAPWAEIFSDEYDEDFETDLFLKDGEEDERSENEPDDCYCE